MRVVAHHAEILRHASRTFRIVLRARNARTRVASFAGDSSSERSSRFLAWLAVVYAMDVRFLLALVVPFSIAGPASALEYCFLSPTDGTCTPALPCAPAGCPPGFECAIEYYSYAECAPIGRVDCCHIPSGGMCEPGFGCVPHAGAYGVCLPWRSPVDFDACVALLDGSGGLDCAAHDCDSDGVDDVTDRCVCIADDQSDGDGDGIGDACDSEPEEPNDAGLPPVLDAGPPYDAGEDPRAMLDVGTWWDAGTDGGSDAGTMTPPDDDGCGCSAQAGSGFPLALVLVLLLRRSRPPARRRRGGLSWDRARAGSRR